MVAAAVVLDRGRDDEEGDVRIRCGDADEELGRQLDQVLGLDAAGGAGTGH